MDILCLPRGLPNRQQLIDEICSSDENAGIDGARLDGFDISGLFLVNASMKGVDFRGARCRGVAFPPLEDCNLDGVDAIGSSFTVLNRCTLRRALLSSCRFGARMRQCCFNESSLACSQITANTLDIESFYSGNDFSGADLLRLDAAGAYLPDSCFARSCLVQSRLSRANLRGCDFRGANLDEASLAGADVRELQLNQTSMRGCLIGPEQRSVAGAMRGATTDNLMVVRADTRKFARIFAEQIKCQVYWKMRRSSIKQGVGAFLICDQSGLRVVMSSLIEDNFIRMYSTNDSTIDAFASDIATDYAGWEIDEDSIDVECKDEESQQTLLAALPIALRQMLQIESF
ncbi:MAG: pentapeptide repeat-containing protein [bacterium]|jgi:uncharacterized protein YjbI with pentapeptide repeats|nr:pentapeptide repeat-containing protein [Planctomycetaceae bacterium]